MKKVFFGALLASAGMVAQAQTYAEVAYVQATLKDDGSGVKSSPSALRAIAGYQVHPNVSVEAMVAVGVGDANIKVRGATVQGARLGLDNAVGLYLRPSAKLGDRVEVFARLGYASLDATVSVPGYSDSGRDSGFSYGAGAKFSINASTYISADYMQYTNQNGVKTDGMSIGLGMKF